MHLLQTFKFCHLTISPSNKFQDKMSVFGLLDLLFVRLHLHVFFFPRWVFNYGRKPELTILHTRIVVSPRPSN